SLYARCNPMFSLWIVSASAESRPSAVILVSGGRGLIVVFICNRLAVSEVVRRDLPVLVRVVVHLSLCSASSTVVSLPLRASSRKGWPNHITCRCIEVQRHPQAVLQQEPSLRSLRVHELSQDVDDRGTEGHVALTLFLPLPPSLMEQRQADRRTRS